MSRRGALVVALGGAAGCAQFRPPAEGASAERGGGGHCAAAGQGYSYADEHGTEVAEADGLPLRLHGTLAGDAEAYAGVGLSFADAGGPVDATRYQGVAFTARRAASSVGHVRFKIPDRNTDPGGGVCTECYNDFGIAFQVTETATRYEARFAALAQETGWGAPRPTALDASRLYGLQWQVTVPGAAVDLWIDDVTFLGCAD